MRLRLLLLSALLLSPLAACGDGASTGTPDVDAAADAAPDSGADAGPDATPDAEPELPPIVEEGTLAAFALDGPFDTAARFYDHPWPSDLRLTADGTPAMHGLPNPVDLELIQDLIDITDERPGFPVTPVAWFRFSAALPERSLDDVIPAAPTSSLLLVDIDPDSPERGRLIPTIATVLPTDGWAPEHTLAVAPRQGFVLNPERTYAFVVQRSALDAAGAPLGVPGDLQRLARGEVPDGALGEAAAALFAPLWPTLDGLGIAPGDVAAATVFTTGDVVAETAALSDAMVARYDLTIDSLQVDPDDGDDHPRFCELKGTVTLPQLQRGTPPFDTQGLFELDDAGAPLWQADVTVPIVITFPRQPMPAGGYPLVMYFHGSGGLSSQVVDRGRVLPDGTQLLGEGPAHVLAAHGFGTVGTALPVNPERVPGASAIAYLNLGNLKAFRDTFRQGVIEQRLVLEALTRLRVPADVVASCGGMTLPEGETEYRYADSPILAMGQSMGGMYTNMIAAVEPRIQAVVPTGAGGFWSWFILETTLLDATPLLALLLDTDADRLSFVHPALHAAQTAWEPAEPMVYMPRLGQRPLPGHPVRSIYEPVGLGDSYFPYQLYDALVLSYGHPQAGDVVWPSMQESLALAQLDGPIDYPVVDNLTCADDTPFTGVVVQYAGDGYYDPHSIFAQLDEVKHQYGCFFESFLRTGVATVPAPAPLGTPCAGIE